MLLSDVNPTEPDAVGGRVVAFVGRPAERSLVALADRLRTRNVQIERFAPEALTHEHILRLAPHCLVVDLRAGDPAVELLGWYCKNVSHIVLTITEPRDVLGRLRALELGAADHMLAPFALGEGLARVEALLARQDTQRGLLHLGEITIDLGRRMALRGNAQIPLTPRELDVLVLLARNRDRITSKQELMDEIWSDKQASPNAVEAAVSSLRRKLHRPGMEIIRTVHRAGYTLRVSEAPTVTRGSLVAERDRVVRERDDAIARRDKVIRQLRDEIDVATSQARQHEMRRRAEHRDATDG